MPEDSSKSIPIGVPREKLTEFPTTIGVTVLDGRGVLTAGGDWGESDKMPGFESEIFSSSVDV